MSKKSKVLVIGWDAADWRVIRPLLRSGRMPHLKQMMADGVSGNLRTLSPAASPILWTSIATGKRPYKHGVLGFTEPDPLRPGAVRPVSAASRKTRAIWNILNLEGKRSQVVGWWPSDPAEPIRGTMVSNLFMQTEVNNLSGSGAGRGSVHPPELLNQVRSLVTKPYEITEEVVAAFIPDFHLLQDMEKGRFDHLRRTIAEASSAQNIITTLMQNEEWDFAAVYLDAIDHICHSFMDFHPPRPDWVSEDEFHLYSNVVNATYHFHDMMLGFLLHLAGPDTTVLLLSDHGFESGDLRSGKTPLTPVGPVSQHRDNGILVMRGPGIRRGVTINGASLLDITPTILQVMGLPVGDDMDGGPLVNAFIAPQEVRRIASWDEISGDDGRAKREHSANPEDTVDALNRLIELGYVEETDAEGVAAIRISCRESQFFLAQSLIDGGKIRESIPLLRELVSEWPQELRFAAHLVRVLQVLGRFEESAIATEQAIESYLKTRTEAREKLRDPLAAGLPLTADGKFDPASREVKILMSRAVGPDSTIYLLQSSQAQAEGRNESALKFLDLAEQHGYQKPNRHCRRAQILMQSGRWEEASRAYLAMLEFEPEHVGAMHGLSRCNLGLRNYSLALQYALDAVALEFNSARSHFLLGVCLQRSRRWAEAAEAHRMATVMSPRFVPALQCLLFLAERRLQDTVLAENTRRRLAAALQDNRCNNQDQESDYELVNASDEPASSQSAEVSEGSENGVFGSKVRIPTLLEDTVIVVSGLPRTGTSMMMQVLQAGGVRILDDQHREADASNARGYCEDRRVKSLHRDATWLEEAQGKAVKIVAPLIPHLRYSSGLHYGVIFMDRDLREVLQSQQVMLQKLGRGGSGGSDRQLEQVFRSQLKMVQRVLREHGVPVLTVRYQDCLREPERIVAAVDHFLGGGLDQAAMIRAIDRDLCHQTPI